MARSDQYIIHPEESAQGFSEPHQRHVRTTFQYIDKLLSEAEHTMADAGSPSPFRRHSDDTFNDNSNSNTVALYWNF